MSKQRKQDKNQGKPLNGNPRFFCMLNEKVGCFINTDYLIFSTSLYSITNFS